MVKKNKVGVFCGLLFFVFFFIQNAHAQLPEKSKLFSDDVWFFGQNTGAREGYEDEGNAKTSKGIRFRTVDGVVTAFDASGESLVNSWENSLSISTPACDGAFVFYVQHNRIYNSSHKNMKNGGISGHTSTGDGLAAAFLGDNKYFLASVSWVNQGDLQYSIVDMDKLDEEGGVGEKILTTTIDNSGKVAEAIEMIPVFDKYNQYWLIYCLRGTPNTFVVKKVDGTNPSAPEITEAARITIPATVLGAQNLWRMHSSPDYSMIALDASGSTLSSGAFNNHYFFDFDPKTGAISYNRAIDTRGYSHSSYSSYVFYGKYLYISESQSGADAYYVYQYDISTPTWTKVAEKKITAPAGVTQSWQGGGMKLGPDGRIYIIRQSSQYTAVIKDPSKLLTATGNFDENGFKHKYDGKGITFSTGLTPPWKDPDTSTPPTANPDVGATNQYLPVKVKVLANDSYGGGDELTLSGAYFTDQTKVGQGSVSTNATTGEVTFTPNPNYDYSGANATVLITYSVQSNTMPIPMCGMGTLTITVTPTHVRSTLFSDDVWFFGLNNGLLENVDPVPPSNNTSKGIVFENVGGNMVPKDASKISRVNARENSLSVSTPACNGSYIFYTQHDKVYKSNHEEMGGFNGNYSCSDGVSAAYLGENKYVLFSVTGIGGNGGLTYYIIDMAQGNGMGTLSSAIATLETAGTGESSELIPKVDKFDEYWLVTTHPSANKIKVRSVSAQAPGTPSAPKVQLEYEINHTFAGGYIYELIPNGNYSRLALANADGGKVDLFDFNPATGEIKFNKSYDFTGLRPYGLEFSPNGQYLYVGFYGSAYVPIRQINLLDNSILTIPTGTDKCVDMKLGPDDKIYVMRDGSNYMGVISKPNEPINTAGNYIADGLQLSSTGGGIKISTGLTPPWENPTSANHEPNITNDEATTTSASSVVISPLDNDDDDDTDQELYLVGVEFATTADAAKGTITFDEDTKEVTFKPNTSHPFTDNEKVNIIYTVRDNGAPVALCAKGVIEITIKLAKLSVTMVETVVDEGNQVNLTVCMPDGTVAPSGGLPFNINLVAGSTAEAADYEVIGTTTIPADDDCVAIKIKASVDNLLEIDDEQLILNAKATGYTAQNQDAITIKDKTDGTIVVETASPASGEMAEPSTNGSFRVKFKDGNVTTAKRIRVTFTLTGAESGVDYAPISPMETVIEKTKNAAIVDITVNDNYVVQGDRKLKIELTNAAPIPIP